MLLRHDYPPELDEIDRQANDPRAALGARLVANIHIFERV